MPDLPDPLSDWHKQIELCRMDFLTTELALANAFADLVTAELKVQNLPAAQHSLSKAEEAFSNIARFLPHIYDPEHFQQIQLSLFQLREKLDSLQPLL